MSYVIEVYLKKEEVKKEEYLNFIKEVCKTKGNWRSKETIQWNPTTDYKMHECLIESKLEEDSENDDSDLSIILWISLRKHLYPYENHIDIESYKYHITIESIGAKYSSVVQFLAPLIACEYFPYSVIFDPSPYPFNKQLYCVSDRYKKYVTDLFSLWYGQDSFFIYEFLHRPTHFIC